MAVKPWLGVVKNSVPSNYKPQKGQSDAPEASLELEYVHGYRCEDARNNLKYTRTGNVVYHTAAVGVVLNPTNNTQKHFMEHNDDILCLAIHPELQIVATGEIGPNPLICVWDTTTMECLARISGVLKKGIMQLCFSNNGVYLAASAADDYHCVAVYDWKKCSSTIKGTGGKDKASNTTGLVATGQGSRANILHLAFNPTDDTIAAPSVKEVGFITFAGGVLKVSKGTGWGKTKQQAILCGVYLGPNLVTGSFDGQLLVWKGRSLAQTIPGHKGCVNCICLRADKNGVITGGNDGLVIIWDSTLKRVGEFSIVNNKTISSYSPRVRSICESGENKLIGTRGGEIVELKRDKPRNLMKGHFKDELWGLAIHPKKPEYPTFGQDSLFSVWDIALKRQKQFAKIDCPGNVLAYSPDGVYLALGLTNGQVIVLDAEKNTTSASRKDRTAAISEIKFSPNCQVMAVGAHDSLIFIYDIPSKFKLKAKLKGHHSTITHFDFTENSSAIQSNCTSYEILYFDVSSGKQMTGGATAFKDEKWASWTCVLGWPVQGIWPPCSDGSDINAVDRSPDCKVLSTGDDFGKVKLFKYPCPIEKSSFNVYRGHSSHVTCVRFSSDMRYLISVGGHDKSIFQWKYVNDKEGSEESESIEVDRNLVIDEITEKTEKEIEREAEQERKRELAPKEEKKEGGIFSNQEIEKGDEFMAVKPFLGEVLHSIPSNYKPSKTAGAIPDANLKIRYAHGYRSFDTRNNLKWTKNGLILYHTAALGIVLDPEKNEQTYFIHHEEDIVSLAIHPNGMIAATGQMAQAGKAKMIEIYVWNIETKEVLACLKGFHRRAVRHLRFSPNGIYLLSIGEDDDHSLAIYDWANKKMVTNAKVDGAPVTTCEFKSDNEFITCGVKHVKFWTISGLNITGSRGLMGAGKFEPQISAAFAFPSKTCVTGSSTGSLIVWAGRNSGKRIPAHTGQVWALLAKGGVLISGGQDGIVAIWDQNFVKSTSIDINKFTKINPGVRAIDVNNLGAYIFGTKGSEIVKFHQGKPSVLIRGHFAGEVWGLCSSPNGARFASCGGDKTLRLWNVDKMALIMLFPDDGRAIDWSSNGNYIIYGTVNGHVFALNPNEKLKTMSECQSSFGKDQWIEDIKISPNSQMVAFGAHRGVSKIEVLKINEDGSGLSKLYLINAGFTSALTHLDWDVTSSYLVSNSQAYELKFVNVLSQTVISATSSRDIDWNTWTCVLGFPVQGVFPPYSDGTDVNSVCRSNSHKVLASGDDFSKVKLFKYPCVEKQAAYKQYLGHSSHVTKVKFSFDDKYLFSTGGNDKTVIVWSTDIGPDDIPEAEKRAEEKVGEEELEETKETKEQENAYDETNLNDSEQITKEKNPPKPEAKGGFEEEKVVQGTEFMASKPWIGALREPTGFIKPPLNQSQPPKVKLELEYVHGYRSRDCKNNISYLSDGQICYHAAALGIVLDSTSNTQKFFAMHTDDILSIAFHPDGVRVATGQLGPKPFIYIWNSSTCTMMAKFGGKLEKGIKSLSFSPSGDFLAALDMNQYHMLAVYDVNNNSLLALCKTDPSIVLQVSFKTEMELITVGVKHYMFWQINNKNLTSKRGIFKEHNNIIGCLATDKTSIFTGNVLGEIYQWSMNSIMSAKKVHSKALDCITLFDEMIFTGGRDAKINIMDKKFAQIMTIDFGGKAFNSISPGIRSLTLDKSKSKMLVGTYGSEIYELALDLGGKKVVSHSLLMQGHYSPCKKTTNEIWGLANFPAGGKYATVSDDATLRIWKIAERKQDKLIRFDIDAKGQELPKDPSTQEIADNVKARSVALTDDGSIAAVGFKSGTLMIVDIAAGKIATIKNDCKEWIADVKFSPNGSYLAIASHDNRIIVYNFPAMTVKSILKGHSSYVRHIDWSVDSHTLHSNSGDYELLFWDVESGKQVPSGATAYRNEKWATWTCIIGWPVQEIWPPASKGTDINACARSNVTHDSYPLLATADDFSTVKIFRYPCVAKKPAAVEGKGHSSHVTNVRFSHDDSYVFSSGGNDGCVFQWKLK